MAGTNHSDTIVINARSQLTSINPFIAKCSQRALASRPHGAKHSLRAASEHPSHLHFPRKTGLQ